MGKNPLPIKCKMAYSAQIRLLDILGSLFSCAFW